MDDRQTLGQDKELRGQSCSPPSQWVMLYRCIRPQFNVRASDEVIISLMAAWEFSLKRAERPAHDECVLSVHISK